MRKTLNKKDINEILTLKERINDNINETSNNIFQ